MRIVNLVCPNCSAPFSVAGDRKYVFCAYCGHQIFLDDETVNVRFSNAYEAGQEFERGRQSAAQSGPNMELAKQIQRTREKAARLEDLDVRIQAARAELDAEQSKSGAMVIVALICMAIVCFAFAATPVLGILAAVIAVIILAASAKGAKSKRENAVRVKQEKVDKLIQDREQISRQNTGIVVSHEYMTKDILDKLYTYVTTERAYTLQQAINVYEDKQHIERLEQLTRENRSVGRKKDEDDDHEGSGLGKTLLVGGIALAVGMLLGKDD